MKLMRLINYTTIVFLSTSLLFGTTSQSSSGILQEEMCLAEAIYFEARAEPTAGMVAVANVILNRVSSADFPNTICDVVHQGPTFPSWKDPKVMIPVRNRCQFSYYCDGKSDEPQDERMYERSLRVALMMLTIDRNMLLDITDGALFYHATYVNPDWNKNMTNTLNIGGHKFFRP